MCCYKISVPVGHCAEIVQLCAENVQLCNIVQNCAALCKIVQHWGVSDAVGWEKIEIVCKRPSQFHETKYINLEKNLNKKPMSHFV